MLLAVGLVGRAGGHHWLLEALHAAVHGAAHVPAHHKGAPVPAGETNRPFTVTPSQLVTMEWEHRYGDEGVELRVAINCWELGGGL